MLNKIAIITIIGLFLSSCTSKKQIVATQTQEKTKIQKESFMQKVDSIIKTKGIEEAMVWFENNKKSKSYVLEENEINELGYKLLYEHKNSKEAIKIFKLNVTTFPESGNVYDSIGEAYLANGDYDLSVENYKKAAELTPLKYFHHLGFLPPKPYTSTKISDNITDLFVSEGNWENEIAFVYVQGGPDFQLHINEKDGLHLMDEGEQFLKIYPYQSQMLNPNLLITNPSLSQKQSTFENAQSVEILHQTITHLKNKGKKVFLIGHSYGASICMEYLNTKEVLAEKVVLMGLDLDEDISSWDTLKPGEYIRWKDGVEPFAKVVFGWIPQDYPVKEFFNNVTNNLEMLIRVNMQKKYSDLLKPEVLKKVVAIYATQDEANGRKSQEEINFLESNGAIVVATEGDHHSMLTKEFMNKLYEHLIKGTAL